MKKTFYLGIDVGGTRIRGILLNSSKNQWSLIFDIPTPQNRKSFLNVLGQKIKELAQKTKILGIGVGLPGIIDEKRGISVKTPMVPFLDHWQAKKFFLNFNKNVKIDNDSKCFLRSEALLGAGKIYKDIVALTIGTGIGSGIMINGKVYNGSHNGAGEFGHTIIDDKKTFIQLGAKKAFFKMGDRSEIIGIGVANIINSIDPEIIILGGGGVMKGGVKINVVKKVAKKYIMSPLAKKTPIIKGKLGEYSQAVGAGLLIKYKK